MNIEKYETLLTPVKIIFCVPFEKKEEAKNRHLQWDCKLKKWVVNTLLWKLINSEYVRHLPNFKILDIHGCCNKEKAINFINEQQLKRTKPRCIFCDGVLVPIGESRKNGACHKDWHNRDMHKSCFSFYNENLFDFKKTEEMYNLYTTLFNIKISD